MEFKQNTLAVLLDRYRPTKVWPPRGAIPAAVSCVRDPFQRD